MELIESKILVFRAQEMEHLNELEQQERFYYQEMKLFEERISKVEYNDLSQTSTQNTGASIAFPEANHAYDKNASGLLPQVVEYQVFRIIHGSDKISALLPNMDMKTAGTPSTIQHF